MSGSRENSARKANYSLLSTRSFLKDLRKLDKADNRRILQAIELLEANPYVGKYLRGQLDGFRSLRVGDFRVAGPVASEVIMGSLEPMVKERARIAL